MAQAAHPTVRARFPGVPSWSPQTRQDHAAIREELERILLSSVFRNSKRYSDLLRFVVEQSLEGRSEHLKERTIGVEVFGRAANYDTNADHVVRSAAGEVRKRLAQYQMEQGPDPGIRIHVPLGSYVPQFELPAPRGAHEPFLPIPNVEESLPVAAPNVPARRRMFALVAIAAVAVVALLGMGTGTVPHSRRTLDRFWGPVLASSTPVLVAIGNRDLPEPSAAQSPGSPAPFLDRSMTVRAFHGQEGQKVNLNDSIALARLIGLLQERGEPYRILSHTDATLNDLHNGPAILIGFRSNYWTRRLVDQSPFIFEKGAEPDVRVVRDKTDPARKFWSVDLSTPYLEFARDYALVLRVHDPKTEQMVVTAAGITCFGTLAAGEFLTDPNQIKKLEAVAPRDWDQKNLALVLSTDIIKASTGPPNIVAAKFW